MADTPQDDNVHLLVLLHGMWGTPNHLAEMRRIYDELRGQEDSSVGPDGERLHIIIPETNKESQTYDGIDWGGERVAEEVLAEVKRLEDDGKKVTRFSVTGYSLGGLVARYLLGVLHQRKFFDTVEPVNFTTVATPHIGIVQYPTWRSNMFAFLGPRLLSRTGEQFYAVDKWSATGRSLLEVMADPDRVFYQALTLFPHKCFYANAVNDVTVPYPTAAVETDDIFADHTWNGMVINLDEEYSPIIKSYELPATPFPEPVGVPRFSAEWWKSLQPRLPPIFPSKFPYNVLVIVSLPLLIPTLMTVAVVRLSLDSRSSRTRIKLLESGNTYPNRLANVIGTLEKRVEDVVVDYIDNPGDQAESSGTSTPLTGATATPARSDSELSDATEALASASASGSASSSSAAELGKASHCTEKKQRRQRKRIAKKQRKEEKRKAPRPLITDLQRQMAGTLNALPGLRKELVYIHPTMNSHAVIVARDVKRFDSHKQGWGVLRHLADHFVI